MGLLAAVPALLLAGPLIGFFGGQWLDTKFGTDPWLMTFGVIFGIAAAGKEIWRLVKKAEYLNRDDKE